VRVAPRRAIKLEGTNGLNAWRDLFLDELKERFVGDHHRRDALVAAFQSLDRGKRYVREGFDWLKKELSL
jgi:hypothetical protein